jgi:hypothetical protein
MIPAGEDILILLEVGCAGQDTRRRNALPHRRPNAFLRVWSQACFSSRRVR